MGINQGASYSCFLSPLLLLPIFFLQSSSVISIYFNFQRGKKKVYTEHGKCICKFNQFNIQKKQIIMIVQLTDSIDLLHLILRNNVDLFPDKRKDWVIILFAFIQLHFVCKFLEVQFAKSWEVVLYALLALCFSDDIQQGVHVVRLCWLACYFHAEVPGILCAFYFSKLQKSHLWWQIRLKNEMLDAKSHVK